MDVLRQYPIYQVDAFTDQVFGGNPAGVVPDAEGLSDEEMHLIAREMNLSETAFITREDTPNHFAVRFFTPTDEVDLCGHATVGSFWLLADQSRLHARDDTALALQRTRAGDLRVQVDFHGDLPARVLMDQAAPTVIAEPGWDDKLVQLLGIPRESTADLPEPKIVSTGLAGLMVPVRDRQILWSLSPDAPKLGDYCRKRGIISVHCFALDPIDDANDIHCRDFSPAVGVPEDPATGTACGALAAYLVYTGSHPGVKSEGLCSFAMEQGHFQGRPGLIQTEVDVCDGSPVSVRVGGAAQVVIEGMLRLP